MAYDDQLDKITQREINPSLNDKIDSAYEHKDDMTLHISAEERQKWNDTANTGTANGSEDGFMSKEDKIKLDGIDEYANNYVHPQSGATVGTYNVVTVNEYGHVTSGANPTRMDITVANSEQLNGQDADYYAPRRSPIFLGAPQCPTADLTADNTQVANTTWVIDRLTKFKDEDIILGIDFTGLCTCPSPAANADNTQIPNTAWVRNTIDSILADYRPVIVGLPYIWHSDTLPNNALWCDGSSFDTARYPELAKVYPNGKVPDYRGVVLRMRDRGKGYDANRTLGSYQSDAIRNITGTFGLWKWYGNVSGVFSIVGSGNSNSKNGGSDPGYKVTFDASRQVPTAGEVRMKNIAVNYIVFTTGFSVLEQASEPLPTYTITVTQPEHGQLLINGSVITTGQFQVGDQLIISLIPDNGYITKNITVDGVTHQSPYTMAISGNHKISGAVALASYTVTVSQPTGASITLDGEVVNSKAVNKGDNVIVDVEVEEGYALSTLYIDGNAVTPPYTLVIGTSSVYISADVVTNTSIITITQPGIGGFITVNGSVTTSLTVVTGTEVEFNANINEEYELDFINIDNISYRTLPQNIAIEHDTYVYAQFKIKQTTDGGDKEPEPEPEPGTGE